MINRKYFISIETWDEGKVTSTDWSIITITSLFAKNRRDIIEDSIKWFKKRHMDLGHPFSDVTILAFNRI